MKRRLSRILAAVLLLHMFASAADASLASNAAMGTAAGSMLQFAPSPKSEGAPPTFTESATRARRLMKPGVRIFRCPDLKCHERRTEMKHPALVSLMSLALLVATQVAGLAVPVSTRAQELTELCRLELEAGPSMLPLACPSQPAETAKAAAKPEGLAVPVSTRTQELTELCRLEREAGPSMLPLACPSQPAETAKAAAKPEGLAVPVSTRTQELTELCRLELEAGPSMLPLACPSQPAEMAKAAAKPEGLAAPVSTRAQDLSDLCRLDLQAGPSVLPPACH
jgi:hypothetical protein